MSESRKSTLALVYTPGVWELAMPPIGIAYLSSHLKKAGYPVELFDLNIELMTQVCDASYAGPLGESIEALKTEKFYDMPTLEKYNFYMELNIKYLERKFEQFVEDLQTHGSNLPEDPDNPVKEFFMRHARDLIKYDVVGLSVIFEQQIPGTLILAQLIKMMAPHVKVVIGGTAVSVKDYKHVADKIILGDGEKQLLGYLQQVDAERHEGVAINREVARIQLEGKLDSLNAPDYKSFFEKYDYVAPKRVIPLPITRGCYFGKCLFCSYGWVSSESEKSTARYRKPQVDKILEDIIFLREQLQTNYFYFTVDVTDHPLLRKLCTALVEQGVEIYWRTEIRAEKAFLKEGLLDLMHKAGCRTISFGLESIEQRVLDVMDKGVKAENNIGLVHKLYESGIGINTDFFVGFPTETPAEAASTQSFVFDNCNKIIPHSPGGTFNLFAKSPLAKSEKLKGLKYVPARKEWLKAGMSFVEQERQQQVGLANMVFDRKMVRFPFRNDGVIYYLYTSHYTIDEIVTLLRSRHTFLQLYRQTHETFRTTFDYIVSLTDAACYEQVAAAYTDELETAASKAQSRVDLLDVHLNLMNKIIDTYAFDSETTIFLHQVARLDYFLLRSCLSEGSVPAIFTEHLGNFEPRDLDNLYLTTKCPMTAVFTEEFPFDVEKVFAREVAGEVDWGGKYYAVFNINGVTGLRSALARDLLDRFIEVDGKQSVASVIERWFDDYSFADIVEALSILRDRALVHRHHNQKQSEERNIADLLDQLQDGALDLETVKNLLV